MLAGQRNTHFSPWSQLGQVQATRFSSRLLFGDAARALLASHSVVGAGVDAPLVLTVTTCHLPGSFGSCWICWPEREIASYLMAWKRDWELFVGEKRWGVICWPARDIGSYLLANQNRELFSGCQLSWVNVPKSSVGVLIRLHSQGFRIRILDILYSYFLNGHIFFYSATGNDNQPRPPRDDTE